MGILSLDTFSAEEEIKYISEYKRTKNTDLRDFIINSNIKLVKYFMKIYVHCSPDDYDDYFQEGCIALVLALEHYDITKGYRFSTYASWWLRQAFQKYRFKMLSSLHLPAHVCEDLTKIYRQELDDNISGIKTNLSEALNHDEDYINCLKNALNTVSLNRLLRTDEDDTELEALICNNDNKPIDYDICKEEIKQSLFKAFDIVNLNKQEQDVILKRFGFYDGDTWTLKAIGDTYGLTKERIRQIENKALKKLRSCKVRLLFKEYEGGNIC